MGEVVYKVGVGLGVVLGKEGVDGDELGRGEGEDVGGGVEVDGGGGEGNDGVGE